MSNQTLEQLLHARISEFTASERPKEIIDQHVEKMFESVVENAFRSHGGMGTQVKEAIKAAMPGNISDMMGLARYNSLIANAMRNTWESSGIAENVVQRAQQAAQETLKEYEIPEAVSLEKLLVAFVEEHAEEAQQSGWEHPKIEYEEDGRFIHLYFDKDPEEYRHSSRSKYSLDNSLAAMIEVEKDTNHGGFKVARVYAAKLEGDHLGKNHFGGRSEYDKLVIALYYGNAKLVLDCDPDDVSYPTCY